MQLRSGKVISRENSNEEMNTASTVNASTTANTSSVNTTTSQGGNQDNKNRNDHLNPSQGMTTAISQVSSFGVPTSSGTFNTVSAPLYGMPPPLRECPLLLLMQQPLQLIQMFNKCIK